jgi:HD superfamily phosphohydrolase
MLDKIIRIPDMTPGYDELVSDYISIIDTPQFQRLRDIRQLDLIDKVFPGAKHTRFEHSIGVLHHERQIIKKIEEHGRYKFDPVEKATAEMAALLHDFAHPPFSHAVEYVLMEYGEPNHDKKVFDILYDMEKEIANVKNVDFDILIDIFNQNHPIAQTIWTEPMCADTLDYINRDANRCGVSVNSDVERLETYSMFDGETYGVVPKVEEVLKNHIGSYIFMYLEVYNRKACSLWKGVIRRGVYEAIANSELKPQDIWMMNDIELLSSLKRAGGVAKTIRERIDYRIRSATFLTVKIEGFEEYEETLKKPIKVLGLPQEDLQEVVKQLYTNNIVDFERYIESTLGSDGGTATVADMPHILMLEPKDVPIYSPTNGWTTLFKRNPKWKRIFGSDIRKKYALRFGVTEKFREQAYEQADEIYDELIARAKI